LEQVERQLSLEKADSYFEMADFVGSHNAVTNYPIGVCHDLKWVENASEWTNLQSVVQIKSKSNKGKADIRYYISSIGKLEAKQAALLAREHWSVENKLIGRRPCGT
jgi:hypothetical protein